MFLEKTIKNYIESTESKKNILTAIIKSNGIMTTEQILNTLCPYKTKLTEGKKILEGPFAGVYFSDAKPNIADKFMEKRFKTVAVKYLDNIMQTIQCVKPVSEGYSICIGNSFGPAIALQALSANYDLGFSKAEKDLIAASIPLN
ncbi:Uncharacterised protein [Candidatus Tiddalikarchaeum anstoanum]|nr:Uncharacterised protein [Candidatus Tiddalikarchaeum anstoanum]